MNKKQPVCINNLAFVPPRGWNGPHLESAIELVDNRREQDLLPFGQQTPQLRPLLQADVVADESSVERQAIPLFAVDEQIGGLLLHAQQELGRVLLAEGLLDHACVVIELPVAQFFQQKQGFGILDEQLRLAALPLVSVEFARRSVFDT